MDNKFSGIEDINVPVNIEGFVDKFTEKFSKFGYVTQALKETWKLNCLALNNAIISKDNVIKFIVSAPTGSAKTENVITYCSMLPIGTTALISTNLTAEADRLAEAINKESSDERAYSLHSKNKSSEDIAVAHQVIVVTHEFYKRHYAGDDIWIKLGENRDLIVIDEAMDTMVEISVDSTQINRAITVLTAVKDLERYWKNSYFDKELQRLKAHLHELSDAVETLGNGTNLLRSNKTWLIPKKDSNGIEVLSIEAPSYILFLEILKSDKSIKYSEITSGIDNTFDDAKIRDGVIRTLVNLNVIKGRQVYITSNKGNYSFNRVVDTTPNKSLVCFDATADVNKAYDIRAKYHGDLVKVPRIDNVRNYSNVTMYVTPARTGKSDININVASTVLENVELGEKTLIVTHLKNEAYFKQFARDTYSDKVIDVAHWNALTGLNTWQDYDTCIIAGLNHKPRRYSQNRVLVNTSEDVAFGDSQKVLVSNISETNIVSEIIQAINRIRIRRVSDVHGGCESARIYIILPTLNIELYKRLIENQMSGISMKIWKLPSYTITSKARKGHFDSILEYLQGNLKVGDKVSVMEPRDKLNIKPDSYRGIIGKGTIKQDAFKEKIASFGFEIVEMTEPGSRGRDRKPVKYFHRIS